MKSILVDALRQANGKESEVKLEDSARLEKSSVEDASNDGLGDDNNDNTQLLAHQISPPGEGELELMQTTKGLVVADATDDIDDHFQEAEFDESALATAIETSALRPAIVASTSGSITLFERAAGWTPIGCIALALGAALALALWHGATSGGVNSDTLVQSGQGPPITNDAGAATAPIAKTRFPYVEPVPRRFLPIINSIVTIGVPPSSTQDSAIRISVRRASPAGTTSVDENTFSSLDAAYRAFVSREITEAEIQTILESRVQQRGGETETEIKLLLQRYPDAAPLHYALGTMLAQSSRWPEARVAFATADRLRSPSAGESRQ